MVFNGCQLLVEQYDGDSRLTMMKWNRIFLYLLWHWKCLCSHRVTSKYDSVPICPNHFPIQTNMFHNPTKYIFYFNDQICFTQSPNLIFFWEEIKNRFVKTPAIHLWFAGFESPIAMYISVHRAAGAVHYTFYVIHYTQVTHNVFLLFTPTC